MLKDEMVSLAKQFATAHALDPCLVCAVAEQESGWNNWLNRYEPDFELNPKYRDNIIGGARLVAHSVAYPVTVQTEIKNRCMSWGLLQLLGQTAREAGVKCPLANLADPAYGLDWGCMVLAKKMELTPGDVAAGLLHWNGGANLNYPKQVMARMESYK